MTKNISTFLVILIITMTVHGQRTDYSKLIPAHPTVSALIKPTLTPVTEAAGLPNISIPIYTLQEDNVTIPISLNYQAGGIQISEEASEVGLGWALNTGGVISREIRGIPDLGENPYGSKYLNPNSPTTLPDHETIAVDGNSFYSPNHNTFRRRDENALLPFNGIPKYIPTIHDLPNSQDFQPDMFYFNFNGYSGSFVFKPNGEIFQLEKNGLIIEVVDPSGSPTKDSTFSVTTENGTKYFFNQKMKTQLSVYDTPITYTSAWFLTQVNTIKGRVIHYDYELLGEGGGNHYWPFKTFSQRLWAPGTYQNSHGAQSKIENIYLTKIRFSNNSSVDLKYSETGDRLDIPNSHFLERVEVNSNNKLIKYYDFTYSYFGRADASSYKLQTGDYSSEISLNGFNPNLNLRLKLDKLIIGGEKTYTMDYFEPTNKVVPNKTSMSQDYWGFYNGIRNNYSFIPEVTGTSVIGSSGIYAKRYPVAYHTQIFSLSRLSYPTGGYTEYEYEPNTYDRRIEYDFWQSSNIPTSDNAVPLPTIEKSVFSLSNGSTSSQNKTVYIAASGDVNLIFDLKIYGTKLEKSADRYPNTPFNFSDDAILKVIRLSDNQVIWRKTFDTEKAPLEFGEFGTATMSQTITTNLARGDYSFEAYFNDYNQTYFGQVKVSAIWYQNDVTGEENDKDYVIGGGLRMKSITEFASEDRPAIKRNFNYHYKATGVSGTEVEKSYGKQKTFTKFALDFPYMATQQTTCFITDMKTTSMNQIIGSGINISLIPVTIAEGPVEECFTSLNFGQYVSSASSTTPLGKSMGSYVNYSQVEMTYEDNNKNTNGKTVSNYFNIENYAAIGNNLQLDYLDLYYKFPEIPIPHSGKLIERKEYKKENDDTYTLLSKVNNYYKVNGLEVDNNFTFLKYLESSSSDMLMTGIREFIPYYSDKFIYKENGGAHLSNNLFHFHPLYANRVDLTESKETMFDENGENPITVSQQIFYDNEVHYLPTRTETKDSKGNILTSQTWYPDDIIEGAELEGGAFSNYSEIDNMKYNGMYPRIGQPVQTISINNGKKVLGRTNFQDWGIGMLLPKNVQNLKGILSEQNTLDTNMVIHDYDAFGNPVEISKKNGPVTCYIWGYSKKYPIAKIENATAAEVETAMGLVNGFTIKSLNEVNLDQINDLRQTFDKALVSTYTHDPLVGVTSVTDSRGYVMYYSYDDQNRLKEIKDAQGNLVTDYDYSY